MASKISPNRRRSIAVLNQGQSQSSRHHSRRRAYSIAPGEKLSPNAKRRRSLAPRKSILKASMNLPESAEASALADETTTQSMDLTEIHAQPRKSLARRVSFASHAHIRLFDVRDNTNGSQDPSSSPQGPSDHRNDENRHPTPAPTRRRSSMRRRSSTAFSEFGEQSMEMDEDETAPLPADFLRQNEYQLGGSAVEDDEFTDEDDDDDDMEITEAIRLNVERKRSLSLGGQAHSSLPDRRLTQGRSENQPPRQLPPPQEEEEDEGDMSMSSANSQSFVSEGSSVDESKPMEFTAPVGKSLRPPSRPSDRWLALQAATHAGIPQDQSLSQEEDDEGNSGVYRESEPMELTDAVDRLMRARVSLGMSPGSGNADATVPDMDMDEDSVSAVQENYQEDSFTSTEDSFAGDPVGDRTVNVTTLIRSSLGTQNSYWTPPTQAVARMRTDLPFSANNCCSPSSTGTNSCAPAPASQLGSLFSARPPHDPPYSHPPRRQPTTALSIKAPPSATIPKPFSFSLSRTPAARLHLLLRPLEAMQQYRGRPLPPTQPSPAKRAAVGKLEPSKIALFEKLQLRPGDGNRRTSMVRRPSGYFAQRKSLGPACYHLPMVHLEAQVCERETLRQAIAAPSPTRGSPSPASPRTGSPAPLGRPLGPSRSASPALPTSPAVQPPSPVVAPPRPASPAQPSPVDASFRDTGIMLSRPSGGGTPVESAVTEQWRAGVEGAETSYDDEGPPISIEQFFDMTGIHFMDELTMPKPRQSVVAPPHLRTRGRRRSSADAVGNDLSAWIEESKKICIEAERETEKVTPELFRDFVAADESEQGLLIWYDWKMDWTQRLHARARQEFANLESYAQVMAELEKEQADIAEIENSDQDYLSELKATIAEQSSELEVFRTDVSEGRAKLDRLHERLAEIESEKQQATTAIARAQYNVHIQKESTTSAVFRLKDELEALQDLHLWQLRRLCPIFNPLREIPTYLTGVAVIRAKNFQVRERDPFPRFTTLALQAAQQMLTASEGQLSVRQIVERLGDLWSACSQLRSQFAFLAIKYPLSVQIAPSAEASLPDLLTKVTILFPGAHGKATVSRQTILDAVLARLAQAKPTENHACLLDACIEAMEQYE
ncbi:uncharacterized protein B0H18DRAFT_1086728 [Fomitopsis serialis]|uniref:uncharacterized protein n=1 Tax=Fomitopsis serialis TaxID=139415 RepID=UPI002007981F|nr:uncharacterized protein B0H18DRAFT_1086728 [Neoantrodia serialis]KAH9919107.1 hypothetical protein B0H18DRAFT_1086728 [Neoantrodia serialis]